MSLKVIAIDGPAGSGKTTLARTLANRLGLEALNTGSMYRAVTFAVLQANGYLNNEVFVSEVAQRTSIHVINDKVLVDGVDVTGELRRPDVDRAVSTVAAVAKVRTQLVAAQRAWAQDRGGGVLEGRDIGTVVFPDTDFKFYLTVDPKEAARRRVLQEVSADTTATGSTREVSADTTATGSTRGTSGTTVTGSTREVSADTTATGSTREVSADTTATGSTRGTSGTTVTGSTSYSDGCHLSSSSLEAVSAGLERRNHIDSNRLISPMLDLEVASENSEVTVIDTTNVTCEETVDLIIEHMKSKPSWNDCGFDL